MVALDGLASPSSMFSYLLSICSQDRLQIHFGLDKDKAFTEVEWVWENPLDVAVNEFLQIDKNSRCQNFTMWSIFQAIIQMLF